MTWRFLPERVISRSFQAAGAAVLVLAAHAAAAQDRRVVTEPGLPAMVCATLAPTGPDDQTGSDDQTGTIQRAIDRCRAGQAVRLVAGPGGGRFLSGPLRLKPGVILWIDSGVVLAATTDPRAYDRGNGLCGTIDARGAGCQPFVTIEGGRGGGIVGDGTIDGQGGAPMAGRDESWWQLARRAQREGGKQNAPRLIVVQQARDVAFYRTLFRNAPNFHILLDGVSGATLWGIRIDTPADARNTDGIDPSASQDVTIAHSFVRTGDDNIAIKAGHGATRHVSILDDHFYWGHGLSIGSETIAGVSDILVRGVTLDGTLSGLRIKSDASRGGLVEAVRYEDVCLRGNRRPIDFDTRYDAGAGGMAIPVYRGIALSHVTGAGGALVVGGHDAGHLLEVMLDDVRFDPDAVWQTAYAQFTAGPGGVTPPPPGLSASAVPATGDRCAGRWASFPDQHP
ncbi:glycosyl hydrolase family 28 protein [Sphingomonadaceae bacterium jetA1]|jgi:polygalacturonase|uniref:glycoside hydrolase family 28 protein n=1 Tax=Facivitalis istanbulensis TaxID=3075838 RepID=UPI0034866DF8